MSIADKRNVDNTQKSNKELQRFLSVAMFLQFSNTASITDACFDCVLQSKIQFRTG